MRIHVEMDLTMLTTKAYEHHQCFIFVDTLEQLINSMYSNNIAAKLGQSAAKLLDYAYDVTITMIVRYASSAGCLRAPLDLCCC